MKSARDRVSHGAKVHGSGGAVKQDGNSGIDSDLRGVSGDRFREDRLDLARWQLVRWGRRDDSRPQPCRALRLLGVRGAALLQHAGWPGDFSTPRAHTPFFRLCEDLPHGLGWTADQINEACSAVVRSNDINEGYLRPIALRGFCSPGLNPLPCPVEVFVMCWHWGAYLGDEGMAKGIDAVRRRWYRMEPNTIPAGGRRAANYRTRSSSHGRAATGTRKRSRWSRRAPE